MVHQIKCRGKIVSPEDKMGRWFYGFYNECYGENRKFPENFILDNHFPENKSLSEDGLSLYEVDYNTVGLSTRLFDHSLKEVFEGDILVQCKHITKTNRDKKYLVFWNEEQAGFKLKELNSNSKDTFISKQKLNALKIIGNIFEGEYKL